jgi:hypothetical protein
VVNERNILKLSREKCKGPRPWLLSIKLEIILGDLEKAWLLCEEAHKNYKD